MQKIYTNVTIEKLVFGGQGLARVGDTQKVVMVWNALPGEIVDITIIKQKKNYLEGIATNIHHPSPHRIKPQEEHYLSSSPWQIMDWQTENEQKIAIASETYASIGKFKPKQLEIAHGDDQYGYRNKMEYSFVGNEAGSINFAFFQRGRKERISIEDSKLAHPWLNEAAHQILDWINTTSMTDYNLKSLILRSNLEGEVIAGLFIKDKLVFESIPEISKTLKGIHIFYSTHKSPASVPTELLYQQGATTLSEKIHDYSLSYGLFSFFQVNVPIFIQTISDISSYLERDKKIVDYYSGVGAIGLLLEKSVKHITLVDSEPEAIELASKNITENDIPHAQCFCSPAEKLTEYITSDSTVIVDPPRSGLHKKVIEQLIAKTPRQIMYLSCNISTQARDIELLLPAYEVTFTKLYNYFPKTPHIEGLVILERKD